MSSFRLHQNWSSFFFSMSNRWFLPAPSQFEHQTHMTRDYSSLCTSADSYVQKNRLTNNKLPTRKQETTNQKTRNYRQENKKSTEKKRKQSKPSTYDVKNSTSCRYDKKSSQTERNEVRWTFHGLHSWKEAQQHHASFLTDFWPMSLFLFD